MYVRLFIHVIHALDLTVGSVIGRLYQLMFHAVFATGAVATVTAG